MSVFFYVQNHEVPIAVTNPTVTPTAVGALQTTFSGKPVSTYQSIKKVWAGSTPLMNSSNARFLMALLEGRGHKWSFDDSSEFAYSSKGLYPTVGTVANGTYYSTTTKFGAGGLQVAANSYVQFNVGYDYDWTVLVWQGSNLSTATHYIVNSSGQKWVNGVRNDAASTPFIDVVSGNFRLGDPAGTAANNRFDDAVIIDAKITEEWAADLGAMTSAFGALPLLRCRGEWLQNNTYNVLASDISASFTPGMDDTTFVNDLMAVSFTLNEYERLA